MKMKKKFIPTFIVIYMLGMITGRLTSFFFVNSASLDAFTFVRKVTQLEGELFHFRDQTRLLSALPVLRDFVLTNPENKVEYEKQKTNVEKTFVELAFQDPLVYQIRYFNVDGKEIVRITREKEGIVIQDEQRNVMVLEQDYFQEAIKLNSGEVYTSKLEPKSAQNATIGTMFPVLRFSAPVYVPELKTNLGVVTVSLSGSELLKPVATSFGYDVSIIDENGYYIYHNDQTKMFGDIFKTNFNHYTTFPNEKNLFQNMDDHFFINRYPLHYQLVKKVRYNSLDDSKFWVVKTGSRSYFQSKGNLDEVKPGFGR
jgi:hypothetical protein